MSQIEEIQALLAAYVAATGRPVSLSPLRRHALRELLRLEVSAEDVRAVLLWVRRAVDKGQSGFTEASLDFRNAMKPDTFEERLIALRQARGRA